MKLPEFVQNRGFDNTRVQKDWCIPEKSACWIYSPESTNLHPENLRPAAVEIGRSGMIHIVGTVLKTQRIHLFFSRAVRQF